MARTANDEMLKRLSNQYARMLRVSLAAEWVCDPQQRALLRRGILARYLDLVHLGQKTRADGLLAWRDAELRRLRLMHERTA